MLVNIYIDANILLGVGMVLWSLTRFVLVRFGYTHSYPLQLQLLNNTMLAILSCPVFLVLLQQWFGSQTQSLSDIVVAQYLDGKVRISAQNLEMLLNARAHFVRDLTDLTSPLAVCLIAIAVVGGTYHTFKILRSAFALRRILKSSSPWYRFGQLHIVLSDQVLVPFSTRSLRRCFVVIPTVMLGGDKDIRIAIGHEIQHFRQRDVEWSIALDLLTPLFFWNPLFLLWKSKINQLRELSCDQNLMARPYYDVKSYCECLLRVCQRSLQGGANFVELSSAVPLVSMPRRSVRLLERRILAITSQKVRSPTRKTYSTLTSLLAFLVVISAVLIQRPADWSQDRLLLSTIVNLERLDARNTESPDAFFRQH